MDIQVVGRFTFAAALGIFLSGVGALPANAADARGTAVLPLVRSGEALKKRFQEASAVLSLADRKAQAAVRVAPEIAPILGELRGLITGGAGAFQPRLAGAGRKASSAVNALRGSPALCTILQDTSRLHVVVAGARLLLTAMEDAGRVSGNIRKTAHDLDTRLYSREQGLLARNERAKAVGIDRIRIELRGDLLKAAGILDQALKNKPSLDFTKLSTNCLKGIPTDAKKRPIATPAKTALPTATPSAKPGPSQAASTQAARETAAVDRRRTFAMSAPLAKPTPTLLPVPVPVETVVSKPKEPAQSSLKRMGASVGSLAGIGTGVLGDIIGWGKDIPSGLVKDLSSVGKDLLKGDLVGALGGVLRAHNNVFARTAGGLFDIGAKTLLGTIDGLDAMNTHKTLPRKLTDQEKILLDGVYKGSVNLDIVRVHIGSSSHALLKPPHTIGNTIYFKDTLGPLKQSNGALSWEGQTLVHETGHVWQNQNGGGDYLHKAMSANMLAIRQGDRSKAYDWKSAAAQGVPFQALNPEQQAAMIDNLAANDARPTGRKFLLPQETEYARNAMKLVHAGKGAP